MNDKYREKEGKEGGGGEDEAGAMRMRGARQARQTRTGGKGSEAMRMRRAQHKRDKRGRREGGGEGNKERGKKDRRKCADGDEEYTIR